MGKKRLIIIWGMCLIIMWAVSLPVSAAEETGSMMCDEGVVESGDSTVDVRDKCGQPDQELLEKWIYKPGPSEPAYVIIFKDGRVSTILEEK